MTFVSRRITSFVTAAALTLASLLAVSTPVLARTHDASRSKHAKNCSARSFFHHGHTLRRHRRARAQAKAGLPQQIGALVISESGETILDELSDLEFNPASVAKLVTAYGAIKTFGLDHQFTTKVLFDGKLEQDSGILSGDVYVQGADPDFERADALALKKILADAGVKKITGKLIVSPGFSLGSVADPLWSARSLARVWSKEKTSAVAVKRVSVGQAPEVSVLLAEYQSEPLRETLKEMLSYSQNNVAEQIARSAGGVAKLEEIVTHEAGLAPGSLKLASASGLGKNRVKPKDMMLVLKSLRSELQEQGLDLQDICPVAGIDPGTLDERFSDPGERGSVVGKTGTLPGTDGGTSALVGMFRCQQEDFYFVIFCWRGSVVSFRHQQDELIRRLQSARGGPKPFGYNLSKANG